MTGGYVRYGIVGGALAALALVLACSTSDSASPAPADEDSGPDGATITVASDAEAGPADAALVDATDADAAPRTCSDQSFCRTALPNGQVLRGVWGDGNGTVWAVSEAGSILRWDGAAWIIHTTNPADRYLSIWGVSPTELWIGGSNGLLHGTGATPSTITFTPVAIPGDPTIPVTAIWGTSATDIWAVGGSISATTPPFFSRGRAVHLVAGAWVAEGPAATNVAYMQVWGTPSSGVWIGGSSVTFTGFPSVGLFRRAAGATTFKTVILPPAPAGGVFANPSRVDVGVATSDTTMVVLGATRTAGTVRKTSGVVWRGVGAPDADAGADGGSASTFTWSVEPKPPLPDTVPIADLQLTAAWSAAPNDLWATGLYGRLRHWNGTAWSEAALTVTALPETAALYGIWGESANDFWVVGDNIAIHKHASSP